jgi:hypothetical protein
VRRREVDKQENNRKRLECDRIIIHCSLVWCPTSRLAIMDDTPPINK